MEAVKKEKGKSSALNYIAIPVFIVIAAICILGVYNVLKWKDTTGDYLSSVEQLKATDAGLMDVVFVGSSHTYCGINPSYFWEDKGIAAFDMAVSGQDKDSAYYHLKNLLKTQSPKVVFVDLYALTFDEHAVEGNIYRNLLSLPFSADAVRLVTDYADKDKWADYIARFPVIHTRYRELAKYDFIEFSPNSFGRGEEVDYLVNPGMPEPDYADKDPAPSVLSEKNSKWLERLYELSRKHGFELVFMVLPFTSNENDQHIIDAAAEFADEKGLRMIDFNRIRKGVGLNYDTDFFDTAHVNAEGAKKIAKYLELFMESEYDLADHRGDPEYWQWDEDLKWNRSLETEYRLKNTQDLESYTDILAGSLDMLAIISLEGTYVNDGYDYYGPLSKLEMVYSDYESGGKWIYENGFLEKVYENRTGEEPYYRELSSYDTLRIKYDGDYIYPENVMIGREHYHNQGAYLCITVYNSFLDRVVESKIFW